VERLIYIMDKNDSKTIDFEEFAAFMKVRDVALFLFFLILFVR